jgi:class 3 adenylate cyclase
MEFLENAIPGVFVINAITLGNSFDDLRVSYVNQSLADLFKSSREEFIDSPILSEKYWADPEQRRKYLRALRNDWAVQGVEVELRRSDESHFWVKLFSRVLKFNDNAFQIQGTLIDISLQKQLERDLQLYQKDLEKLVKERTKKLEQAYRELETRNRELEDLLKKVTFLEAIQNQMAKFVPRIVKNIIEKNPELDLKKQDKDVSILFLDIKGCTNLCEKLGRANMNYILERYFSAFLDDIHRNLGDVNETMGDGLMAIYQGEDARENALNSVRSALAILDDTRRINKELDGSFPPVTINMGISSGIAAVGATKFTSITGDRWTYTATGPVTNLSSRLCSAARNGGILIDEETAKRNRGFIGVKEVGERNFKNIGSPVKVLRVVEASSPNQSLPGNNPEPHHRNSV